MRTETRPKTARRSEQAPVQSSGMSQLSLAQSPSAPPHRNRDCGQWRGQRAIWGGRASVRATLSRAARVATRRDPIVRAFHERVVAVGTAITTALVACMGRVLIGLDAVLRSEAPWQQIDAGTSC